MATDSQLFAEINSCQHLFVRTISEPIEGSLRLLIEEGRPAGEVSTLKSGGTVLTGLHRVSSTPECRLYELLWEHYVIYSVLNESFGKPDDSAIYSGHRLRVYSKSDFIDYVSTATIATGEYPGPMQHVGLLSENHVVDVISTVEPRITPVR